MMNKMTTCENDEIQPAQPHIIVGVGNARSELRVSILLNMLPDYHVDIIRSNCRMDAFIPRADLVIGTREVALRGLLYRKPVIVIGGYGSGGLLTLENVQEQYYSYFKGRIGGTYEEYFPLEQLQRDIEKALTMSLQELDSIYDCIRDSVMGK